MRRQEIILVSTTGHSPVSTVGLRPSMSHRASQERLGQSPSRGAALPMGWGFVGFGG
jgi:hypothetical protein